MRLAPENSETAFSLVEATVAAAIAALFLSSLFVMNGAAMDTIRSAKDSTAASQALQQRMESLRIANWHQVTDADWVRDNLLNTPVTGVDSLKDFTETLTLVPYGSSSTGNTQIRRTGGRATIINENTALLSENAVKVIWTAEYSAVPNDRLTSRQIVAILAKGGVAK